MCKRTCIRQYQLLFGNVDVIDVPAIDNKALADANEARSFRFYPLVVNHALYLSQLASHQTDDVIHLNQIGVVPIRGDTDDAVGQYAHDFIGRRYREMGLHGCRFLC